MDFVLSPALGMSKRRNTTAPLRVRCWEKMDGDPGITNQLSSSRCCLFINLTCLQEKAPAWRLRVQQGRVFKKQGRSLYPLPTASCWWASRPPRTLSTVISRERDTGETRRQHKWGAPRAAQNRLWWLRWPQARDEVLVVHAAA